MLISIILPTLNRPNRLWAALASLASSGAPQKALEVIVCTEASDPAARLVAAHWGARVLEGQPEKNAAWGRGAIRAWNEGASVAAGEWLMLGADDIRFLPGWFEAAEAQARPGAGVVGFNDLAHQHTELWATHYIARRDWLIDGNGGVLAFPHYRQWYVDTETCARARRDGAYVYCPEAVVEHVHHMNGKAPLDATYQAGYLTYQQQDTWVFEARRRENFPTDFASVLGPYRASTGRDWTMGCCGNSGTGTPFPAGGQAMEGSQLAGAEGFTQVRYVGAGSAIRTWFGAVTHTAYLFGGGRPAGYVANVDLPYFLNVREHGRAVFEIAATEVVVESVADEATLLAAEPASFAAAEPVAEPVAADALAPSKPTAGRKKKNA